MAPKGTPGKSRKLGTVAVAGESMAPTFVAGDWLLVMWGGKFRVGQAVLVEREKQPGVFLIKRITRVANNSYWVEGDNAVESTDSRQWGSIQAHEIVATVLWRIKKANSKRGKSGRD